MRQMAVSLLCAVVCGSSTAAAIAASATFAMTTPEKRGIRVWMGWILPYN
jgi:hypothetical protein